ncbi:hypothetical protein PHLCEN_2v9708 [Hermanssonia centrifuga]|uniref:Secreted protein n=1 Tax=Hermanssonia centrifuga TaxID=98765 RepID=A0A2R6NPZ2_9APHY|nr:hypothetical protein PHLCEN_2v9708 [Hermanssonia centrifuga]
MAPFVALLPLAGLTVGLRSLPAESVDEPDEGVDAAVTVTCDSAVCVGSAGAELENPAEEAPEGAAAPGDEKKID